MISPTPEARAYLHLALGAVLVVFLTAPIGVHAQGLVQGVQKGAAAGNKAAGPVGGVLGGAIGGVVGVFTGVLGVGNNGQNSQPPAGEPSVGKQGGGPTPAGSAKTAKAVKSGKAAKPAVLTQEDAPQLSAEQIVASSDANIDRIKAELKLTPERHEKEWHQISARHGFTDDRPKQHHQIRLPVRDFTGKLAALFENVLFARWWRRQIAQ
jgi:hypothetical protein